MRSVVIKQLLLKQFSVNLRPVITVSKLHSYLLDRYIYYCGCIRYYNTDQALVNTLGDIIQERRAMDKLIRDCDSAESSISQLIYTIEKMTQNMQENMEWMGLEPTTFIYTCQCSYH
jgi:hypothetical protein